MLAAANQPPSHIPYSNLQATAYNLSSDVGHMRQSRQYSVPPQVQQKLGDIGLGTNHIRLDHELLNSSKGFRERFDPAVLARHENSATDTLKRIGNTVHGVKSGLASDRLSCLYKDDLEKTHYNAAQTLQRAKMDMGEDVCNSVKRLKQFCDYVGVTDRYTSFRHNLNRGNRDPITLGYSWLGQQKKQVDDSKHTGGVPGTTSAAIGRYEHANTGKYYDQTPGNMGTKYAIPARSIQERCGINMTYPGRTEYTKRFPRPERAVDKDYELNPTPDFAVQGRPLESYRPMRNDTEYQKCFEWPSACKVVRLPWLRK